jgi:hypothetical protein
MSIELKKPDLTGKFPDKYLTGKHIFFVPREQDGEIWWWGTAIVNGNVHRCYSHKTEMALHWFTAQFGAPDSVQKFQSQEEAHLTFPKFFIGSTSQPKDWKEVTKP